MQQNANPHLAPQAHSVMKLLCDVFSTPETAKATVFEADLNLLLEVIQRELVNRESSDVVCRHPPYFFSVPGPCGSRVVSMFSTRLPICFDRDASIFCGFLLSYYATPVLEGGCMIWATCGMSWWASVTKISNASQLLAQRCVTDGRSFVGGERLWRHSAL
jgi:hypothetical protein